MWLNQKKECLLTLWFLLLLTEYSSYISYILLLLKEIMSLKVAERKMFTTRYVIRTIFDKPIGPNFEYCVLTPMKIIYEIYIYYCLHH